MTNCASVFSLAVVTLTCNTTHSIASVFGYGEKEWDDGEDLCPAFCDEWWKELTDEQKWAAWVFGYDEKEWNESR